MMMMKSIWPYVVFTADMRPYFYLTFKIPSVLDPPGSEFGYYNFLAA